MNRNHLPTDALVIPLRNGSKLPIARGHGHLDPVTQDEYLGLTLNYGIVLDEKYCVIDIDRDCEAARDLGASLDALGTWKQTTRRGAHWLLRVPKGWIANNTKLCDERGVPYADVKVRGYIVGPGSIVNGHAYTLVSAPDPAPPPAWLHTLIAKQGRATVKEDVTVADSIPQGMQREFAAGLAGFARRYGLSAQAMRAFNAPLLSLFRDQDPARPWEVHHLDQLYRSAERTWHATPNMEPDFLLPHGWRTGDDVPAIPPKQRWLVPGFVPAGELTLVYGDGKIGKSSFASWLAAKTTAMGQGVLFIASGEETFERFVQRCRLNGATSSLLYEYPLEAGFRLPEGAKALLDGLTQVSGIGLIYIDAVYSHFSAASEASNTAEKARANLRPLAELCRLRDVAIVGTFHENAGGGLLGSREMRNVARSLLHAKRRKNGAFTLWVDGANGWAPEYGLKFSGAEHPILEENGSKRLFVDAWGEEHEESIWTLELESKAYNDEGSIDMEKLPPGDNDPKGYSDL